MPAPQQRRLSLHLDIDLPLKADHRELIHDEHPDLRDRLELAVVDRASLTPTGPAPSGCT